MGIIDRIINWATTDPEVKAEAVHLYQITRDDLEQLLASTVTAQIPIIATSAGAAAGKAIGDAVPQIVLAVVAAVENDVQAFEQAIANLPQQIVSGVENAIEHPFS